MAGALIPLAMNKSKHPFVMFHINQALIFQTIIYIVNIALYILGAIGNKTVAVSTSLTFSATSSNPNQLVTTNTWQTFQSFPGNTPTETILFKKPANSATRASGDVLPGFALPLTELFADLDEID